MEFLGTFWGEVITKPMTNSLLLLYVVLFNNLGLGIIAFTVVVKVLTYPLMMRQIRQTQKMQSLQPRMKEIQDRHKNNPQMRSQEVMRLYREGGVNPVGCLGPLVIQMPIFIGLFWAINNVLPFTPENLAGLSGKLYSWLPFLSSVVPINRAFLGMDLALEPVKAGNILAMVLVFISGYSMYLQQKMTQVPSTDPRQQSSQRMMLIVMPLVFGMFSLFFPIGLVIYWVVSNVIGIVMQYLVSGRKKGGSSNVTMTVASTVDPPPGKEQINDGQRQPNSDGEDSGRSDRVSHSRTRRRPRRSRNRRN
jgi:YidC/Oxa1 family membrane protein insertase